MADKQLLQQLVALPLDTASGWDLVFFPGWVGDDWHSAACVIAELVS